MRDSAGNSDNHQIQRGHGRRYADDMSMQGHAEWVLTGPDGAVKQRGTIHNLVTDYGDEWAASRTAGVSAEDAVTGMRLGTGATAVAKSGAGAAIVTYLSGSQKALDATYPQLSDEGAGAGHDGVYRVTWDAGEATEDGIAECVVTNEDPLTNVAGAAGNTVARFLLSPTVDKAADDTLTITWTNRYLGA
jgi:hypothetical protein